MSQRTEQKDTFLLATVQIQVEKTYLFYTNLYINNAIFHSVGAENKLNGSKFSTR